MESYSTALKFVFCCFLFRYGFPTLGAIVVDRSTEPANFEARSYALLVELYDLLLVLLGQRVCDKGAFDLSLGD